MPQTQFTSTDKLIALSNKLSPQLHAMAFVELQPLFAHLTPVYGIQGKATVGTSKSKAQLRPYRTAKDASFTGDILLREIETFLGDVVEEFDPQELWSTAYGAVVSKKPTEADITKHMAMLMPMSVGEELAASIFTAKRKADGNTTMDLFDGFETIIDNDKVAGKISLANKNLVSLGQINSANAVDMVKQFYRSCHRLLRRQKTKLYLPIEVYDMYNDCYQTDHGALPYNKEFKKTFVEGSDNKCELVPMEDMSGTRMILTTKRNMLVGMDRSSTHERVEVRRVDNPKVVQFFMMTYFGTQFRSVDEREMLVGEFTLPVPEE